MTERVLGPKESPRRRWTLLVALSAALTICLFYVAGAQAVHDVSVFQLDTPTADAQVSVGSVAHHDDWDVICKLESTCTLKAGYPDPGSPAATLVASAHEDDGALNATIFQGGGSKDTLGIQSGAWAWKDESGGLPDKDNLLHAYAARYSVAPSTECPVATGLTTCEVIYFGSDRYDNSGDATQAFWFLQNPVGLGSNKVGGGFGFTGSHREGDLLIISEFSNGGTTSTITIYRWTGTDAAGGLTFVAGGTGQKCGGSSPDPFCGIVNESPPTGGTVAPWSFLDKSGNTNFAQGEIYEAGINLSDPSINLAGECFSSFVAETRSATSTTAQLKDFVIGQFQPCGASLTTTPQYTTVQISSGLTVNDSAEIAVTGVASPPAPVGNVNFFLCGPSATQISTCATTGTAFSTINLSTATQAGNKFTVTSSGAAITQVGYYCFSASWAGDSNYTGGPYEDKSAGECFQVTPKPPTISTTSSTTATDVVPGTSVSDSVTVSGDVGTATGTVDFILCQPNEVTAAGCPSGSGTKIGATKTLSSGAATSDATTNTNAIGKYCWRAEYTRDSTSPYQSGSHTNATTECFTVATQPPTISTTSSTTANDVTPGTSVTDSVSVTGSYGTATGTVDFILCQPNEVTAAGCPSGSGTKIGATKTLSSGAATSDATTNTTSLGKYCWRAEYTRDSTSPYQSGSHTNATTECFTVTDSTSITSAQKWLPNDSATVAATNGSALSGTLTIQLYESNDCTGTAVSGQLYSKTLTNATTLADRTLATSNTTYLVEASKSVSWKVVFTPASGSNVTGSNHCEITALTITN